MLDTTTRWCVLVSVAARHESTTAHWRAEALRWQDKAEQLSEQVRELHAELAGVRAKVKDLEGQLRALAERVAKLTRRLFGRSSEKKKRSKPAADPPGGDGQDGGGGEGGAGPKRRRKGQRRGSKGHGRRDYSGLKTDEVIHDLPVTERVCPCCGEPYEAFGEEVSSQVDWVVRVLRIVHVRRRYRRACKCSKPGLPAIVTAPVPPKPLRKSMFSTSFLARLDVVRKLLAGHPALDNRHWSGSAAEHEVDWTGGRPQGEPARRSRRSALPPVASQQRRSAAWLWVVG